MAKRRRTQPRDARGRYARMPAPPMWLAIGFVILVLVIINLS